MPYIFTLFLVIILEGYVVLSSELLAIRQTIPFVGSGTDTVSIIIAAVLMPLAFGYQAGGHFKPGIYKGKLWTIRDKLIFNIVTASFFLLPGLSYPTLDWFFQSLIQSGISNRLILVTLYCAFFIVVPVYLLAQTIPLCSNYFSKERLSKITGKILCFSTLGSFMGAVFSTVILMSFIGVNHTVSINFAILTYLVFLLSRKKMSDSFFISIGILIVALYLNSNSMLEYFHIVENNKYNTIAVYEDTKTGDRHLFLNRNASSKYNDNGNKHQYIKFIEQQLLNPQTATSKPRDFLIIGAGAFTLGYNDPFNHYDYVDIDKDLKDIAETHILKTPLNDNQSFYPVPARAFLAQKGKSYDAIILDAYQGDITIPEHLVTQEFFKQVKSRIKPGGVMIANFITSPNFSNKFTRTIDNTIRSVFKYVSRHVVHYNYLPFNENTVMNVNAIYIHTDQPNLNLEENDIYTDNKNTIFLDKPQKR